MNNAQLTYVGIRICKEKLDVYISDPQKIAQFENTSDRVEKFVTTLLEMNNPVVLFKASKGYELDVLNAVIQNQIPFQRLQPQQIGDFAKSQNLTDVPEAKVLVLFGMSKDDLALQKLTPEKATRLIEMMTYRRTLSDMIAQTEAMEQIDATFRKMQLKTLDLLLSDVNTMEEKITQFFEENAKCGR